MEVAVETPVQEIVDVPVEAVETVVVGTPVEVAIKADIEALADVDVVRPPNLSSNTKPRSADGVR